jgi:hypothetical protein
MNEPPVLKPMTVVQILDASFRIYRENFFLFLGIMAIPYVPVIILSLISYGVMFSAMGEDFQRQQANPWGFFFNPSAQEEGSRQAVNIGLMCGAIAAALAITLVVFLVAIPIAKGALTRAVSDRYLGRPATLGGSYRAVFSIFWRFLGTTMLVGLVTGIGFIFCIIPGIFLFILFAFTSQIMIVEGIAGTNAMGRSKDLGTGHRWRILGLALLTLLVNYAIGCTSGFIFQFILPRLIDSPTLLYLMNTGSGYLIQMLIEPLWGVAWILMYYDVRIRKEAFDLQLLATRVT